MTRIDTDDRVSSVDAQVAVRWRRSRRACSRSTRRQLADEQRAGAPAGRRSGRRSSTRSRPGWRAPAAALVDQRRGAAADRRAAGRASCRPPRARAGAGRSRPRRSRRRPPADGGRGDRRDAGGRDRRAAFRLLAASSASRCRTSARRTSGPAPRRAGSTARASSCTPTRRWASRCRTPRTRCGATGRRCRRDQLQPGDLVFFDGLGHVGLYIGGGEFVHAPQTGDVVKVSSLDDGCRAAARGATRSPRPFAPPARGRGAQAQRPHGANASPRAREIRAAWWRRRAAAPARRVRPARA